MLGFGPTASLPIADDGITQGSGPAAQDRITNVAVRGGKRVGSAIRVRILG